MARFDTVEFYVPGDGAAYCPAHAEERGFNTMASDMGVVFADSEDAEHMHCDDCSHEYIREKHRQRRDFGI